MRMLEPNATSSNASVLASQNNGAGNINAAAGLLPSNGAAMQTLINGATASTGDRLDASSDSAVSSMGSERVPSLSDGEWGDTGSDSAQEYHHRYASTSTRSFSLFCCCKCWILPSTAILIGAFFALFGYS